jgi:hypothetical protein
VNPLIVGPDGALAVDALVEPRTDVAAGLVRWTRPELEHYSTENPP